MRRHIPATGASASTRTTLRSVVGPCSTKPQLPSPLGRAVGGAAVHRTRAGRNEEMRLDADSLMASDQLMANQMFQAPSVSILPTHQSHSQL
jgi:hypothetical protein